MFAVGHVYSQVYVSPGPESKPGPGPGSGPVSVSGPALVLKRPGPREPRITPPPLPPRAEAKLSASCGAALGSDPQPQTALLQVLNQGPGPSSESQTGPECVLIFHKVTLTH